jgi:phosphoribosylamine--glycine ligase
LTQPTLPIVIKASGLARGKGVVICKTLRQANNTLREIMVDKCFGQAGSSVVIEEFLEGYELSVHALSDGKTAVMFPISQDNKAIFDGDKGPNTGGMGVVAPVDILSSSDINYIKTRIVQPIIDEFNRLGHPYVGCLYPGLMITKQGIKVIEYNARFGDPEAQCYMRLLQSDLVEHIVAATKGKLNQEKIVWSDSSAVCIVLASKGYPQISSINTEITGLNNLKNKKVVVFQAGTKKKGKNLFTNGGRVLSITSIGNNSTQARKLAYEAAGQIKFDGMQYRNDIGLLKPTMNSVKNH